jgi:hypothetical protein
VSLVFGRALGIPGVSRDKSVIRVSPLLMCTNTCDALETWTFHGGLDWHRKT